MKKSNLSLTLSALILLSSSAHALELIVVNNYDAAETQEIWKKAKTDQVPEMLLTKESLDAPHAAYASVFPKTFFQESLFAVCHKSCEQKDIFDVNQSEINSKDLRKWDVVEQSNVYFWLKKYFNFLENKLSYRPEKFLRVTTNRELKDETRGKVMKNNAFFNPRDISLSFLPASNNLLFKLLGGKINRSGFDPSVVAHEASHYLFHHLFPNPVNDEIGGLNEGFADYVANIFLQNPKVGLVMMHGKSMRDSSAMIDKDGKLKTYGPGMEVHDLGERVAYALWQSRELSSDKEEMDRLVIDAVTDLGRNPYSTVHDFKEKMLERLEGIIPEANLHKVKTIWEIVFSGKPNQIDNLDFLTKTGSRSSFLGFKTKQVIPENLAKEMGVSSVEESNFSIIQLEKISNNQIAILMASEDEKVTTPYWIAIDGERSNILGIYSLDRKLVTDEEELEKVKFLADQAKGSGELIKDFTTKVKAFSDLSQSKGDLSLGYKVKRKDILSQDIVFNGTVVNANVLKMDLKRKFLTGRILGLPEITSIELILLPQHIPTLPQLESSSVIGYKITLKTGTAMEVMLDKHSLN